MNRSEVLFVNHAEFVRGSVKELDNVTFSVLRGSVFGLVCIDNMGLQRLIDVITTPQMLDGGSIYIDGSLISSDEGPGSTGKAWLLSSSSRLIPALSLADNFFSLGSNADYIIKDRGNQKRFKETAKRFGIMSEADKMPRGLDELTRCELEILRAIKNGAKLIILEYTDSFLSPNDNEALMAFVRALSRDQEISFLYISNHHEEIFRFADYMAAMKNGQIILKDRCCYIRESMMQVISREFTSSISSTIARSEEGQEIAELKLNGQTLILRKGGCMVLLEDTDTNAPARMAESFFDRSIDDGLYFSGRKPSRKDLRLALVPKIPQKTFLFPHLSVIDNLTIKANRKIPFFYSRRKMKESVIQTFRPLLGDDIFAQGLEGLDDKILLRIIFSRIELEAPEAVIMIEPFAGFDMYCRSDIVRYINKLKRKGIAVLILALSYSDTLNVANTLIVTSSGKIDRIIPYSDFDAIQRNRTLGH